MFYVHACIVLDSVTCGIDDSHVGSCFSTDTTRKQRSSCSPFHKAKKNMWVYGHMLKKIRVGRSEIIFFFNLIFYK